MNIADFRTAPFAEQCAIIDHALATGEPIDALFAETLMLVDKAPLQHFLNKSRDNSFVISRIYSEFQNLDDRTLAAIFETVFKNCAPDYEVNTEAVFSRADEILLKKSNTYSDSLYFELLACCVAAPQIFELRRPQATALSLTTLKHVSPKIFQTLGERAESTAKSTKDVSQLSDAVFFSLQNQSLKRLLQNDTPAFQARRAKFAHDLCESLAHTPKSLSEERAEAILSKQIYIDIGHFQAELLQNADDAEATTFRLTLKRDAQNQPFIRVEHDGNPFDARDLQGLLSIGQSTKDAQHIGRFGVGFKSVYAISNRPQVFCDMYAFEIAAHSLPRPVANPEKTSAWTRFILPIKPELSLDAIAQRAMELPTALLLTLKNIRNIELDILGTQEHRTATPIGPHEILLCDGKEKTRFVTWHQDNVLIAVPESEIKSAGYIPFAIPRKMPALYAFLPIEAEPSLPFLLQAPFELQVDRERLDFQKPQNAQALEKAGQALAQLAGYYAENRRFSALETLLQHFSRTKNSFKHLIFKGFQKSFYEVPWLRTFNGGPFLRSPDAILCSSPKFSQLFDFIRINGKQLVSPPNELWPLAQSLNVPVVTAKSLQDALKNHKLSTPQAIELARFIVENKKDPAISDFCKLSIWPAQSQAEPEKLCDLYAAPLNLQWLACARKTISSEISQFLFKNPELFSALCNLGLHEFTPQDALSDLTHEASADLIRSANRETVSEQLISWLKTLPPSTISPFAAELARSCWFATQTGELAALKGEHAAFLPPTDELLAALTLLCPNALLNVNSNDFRLFQSLGATQLTISRCLTKPLIIQIANSHNDLGLLYNFISEQSQELTQRDQEALAHAPIFEASDGERHSLVGKKAAFDADDDLRALFPNGPWISPKCRACAACAVPGVATVEPTDLALALLGEPEEIAQLIKTKSEFELANYFLAHPVDQARAHRLATAEIWSASDGSLQKLTNLRMPAQSEALSPAFESALQLMQTEMEARIEPSAFALAAALGLENYLRRASTSLIDALLMRDPAPLPDVVFDALTEAVHELSSNERDWIKASAIWPTEDGATRPLGSWKDSSINSACYRCSHVYFQFFAQSSRHLLANQFAATHVELLNALNAELPEITDLFSEFENNSELQTPKAAALLRPLALEALKTQLSLCERCSKLAIWPTEAGSLASATELLADSRIYKLLDFIDENSNLPSHFIAREFASSALQFAPLNQLLCVLAPPQVGISLSNQPAPWANAFLVYQKIAKDSAEFPQLGIDLETRVQPLPLYSAEPTTRDLLKEIQSALTSKVEHPDFIQESSKSLSLPQILAALEAACLKEQFASDQTLSAFLKTHKKELLASKSELSRFRKIPLFLTPSGARHALQEIHLSLPDDSALDELRGEATLQNPDWADILKDLQASDFILEKQILNLLIDAEHSAAQNGELARVHMLLRYIATHVETLPEEARATLKLHRRLRILTATGQAVRPRDVLVASEETCAFARQFAQFEEVAATLSDEIILNLLKISGAPTELDALSLNTALNEVKDATISYAIVQYLALILPHSPALKRTLNLDARRFIPNELGQLRAPNELYRPTAQARAAFAQQPDKFPDEAFYYALPFDLGFQTMGSLSVADLAASLKSGQPAPQIVLNAFEENLLKSAFKATEVRTALQNKSIFETESGALVPASALCKALPPQLQQTLSHLDVEHFLNQLKNRGFTIPLREWKHTTCFPRLAAALAIPAQAPVSAIIHALAAMAESLENHVSSDLITFQVTNIFLNFAHENNAELPHPLPVPCCDLSNKFSVISSAAPQLAYPDSPELAETAKSVGLFVPAPTLQPAIFKQLLKRGVQRVSHLFERESIDLGDTAPATTATQTELILGLLQSLPKLRNWQKNERWRSDLEAVNALEIRSSLTWHGRLNSKKTSIKTGCYVSERVIYLAQSALENTQTLSHTIAWALCTQSPREETVTLISTLLEYGTKSKIYAYLDKFSVSKSIDSFENEPTEEKLTDWVADALRKPNTAKPAEITEESDFSANHFAEAKEIEQHAEPIEKKGFFKKFTQLFQSDSEQKSTKTSSGLLDRLTKLFQSDEQNAESAEKSASFSNELWFREDSSLGEGLHAVQSYEPETTLGIAFEPATLPRPYLYAPKEIFGHYNAQTRRWLQDGAEAQFAAPRETGSYIVQANAHLPSGDLLLPVPLYGEVRQITPSVKTENRAGRALLCRNFKGGTLSYDIRLNALPDFQNATRPFLASTLTEFTTTDDELPRECHELIAELAHKSPLTACFEAERFIKTHYRYDPSVLENEELASSLRKATKHAKNPDIAALHLRRDAHFLGQGVCRELNQLLLEILRRLAIPACVSTGWTFSDGLLGAPDHLWTLAILESDIGPRYLPFDAASTLSGRPLRMPNLRPKTSSIPKPHAIAQPALQVPNFMKELTAPHSTERAFQSTRHSGSNELNHLNQILNAPRNTPKKQQKPAKLTRSERSLLRNQLPPLMELERTLSFLQAVRGKKYESSQQMRAHLEAQLHSQDFQDALWKLLTGEKD